MIPAPRVRAVMGTRNWLNFALTHFPKTHMSKSDRPAPPPAAEATPAKDEVPPKRSAMKLPAGVSASAPRGPQQPKPRGTANGGRPQTDFARRAGKSRKVH